MAPRTFWRAVELLSAAHPAAAHGPHVRQHGCPQSHLSGKRLHPGLCRSLCVCLLNRQTAHPGPPRGQGAQAPAFQHRAV